MARHDAVAPSQNTIVLLGALCLLVAVLYWAQTVLMPIALALLLFSVLSPIVSYLQRHRMHRATAVGVVVLVAVLVFGGVVLALSAEVEDIVKNLPTYKENLTKKIRSFRGGQPGVMDKLSHAAEELTKEFDDTAEPGAPTNVHHPQLVRVVPERSTGLSLFPQVALPLGAVFGRISLVIGLTVSMLFYREDLRNRLLRLVGSGRLTSSTRTLEEATVRISRYMLVQATFNLCFGLVFGLGLIALGLDSGLLWGMLAAVLRFIPYIGTWMAAVPPTLLSLAVFPNWTSVVLVVALVVALGMVANYLIEPRLVSRNTGLSPFALIVSAAFWTWLWGPAGLVLSTPMTVCLGVLGRHVPQLTFFSVLLGTEPPMGARFSFYQRLLARDEPEATELVETYLETHSRADLFDDVILPTLSRARTDRERDELDDAEVAAIVRTTRDLVEELPEENGKPAQEETEETAGPPLPVIEEPPPILVLGFPARDEVDELALGMLQQAMAGTKARVEVAGSMRVIAEMVQRVANELPAVVVIAAVPPVGLAQTRHLCKRLRAKFPKLTILVGCWGAPEEAEHWVKLLQAAGASEVAMTLRDSCRQVAPYLSLASNV
jgi:predicted PurR-regulated permease PerM